ncbi:MAG: methyltransferase domain-containing protein [bacterium]|nr:methyltransferase domain-containing protein [bacterium]
MNKKSAKGSFFLRMLNKRASAPEGKPGEVIESLNIQAGDTIADIGSGGGYFSFRFSREVGEGGKVYAVDTNQKYLDYIESQAEQEGINNVTTVLIAGGKVSLPGNSIDIVFTRNVFHHIPDPGGYFKDLRGCLKPGGRIVVIEYKKTGGFGFHALFKHYTPQEKIVSEMERAGYRRVESFDFLPEQSFMVFKSSRQ